MSYPPVAEGRNESDEVDLPLMEEGRSPETEHDKAEEAEELDLIR
jgi:hypothetical protein